MKYMCLVYHDSDTTTDDIPDEEFNSIIDEVRSYVEEMQEAGVLLAAAPLQTSDTAITVRVHRGSLSVTDGPYVETKEQLAGFYLLEARDQNEAVRLISKTPSARIGNIEVRPVRQLEKRGE